MVAWDRVTRNEVERAIQEYDRVGPQAFFAAHGFAPTTTYQLVWEERRYPPKAILGTAYELATGERLASGDFEGGGAGRVPGWSGQEVEVAQAVAERGLELAVQEDEGDPGCRVGAVVPGVVRAA